MNNVNQEVGKYLETLCKYFNEQQSQKKRKRKKNFCGKIVVPSNQISGY